MNVQQTAALGRIVEESAEPSLATSLWQQVNMKEAFGSGQAETATYDATQPDEVTQARICASSALVGLAVSFSTTRDRQVLIQPDFRTFMPGYPRTSVSVMVTSGLSKQQVAH